jgi:hypothetical protein
MTNEEDILAFEVSDEALEAAAGSEQVNYTLGACTGLSVCPGWGLWDRSIEGQSIIWTSDEAPDFYSAPRRFSGRSPIAGRRPRGAFLDAEPSAALGRTVFKIRAVRA